VTRAKRTRRRKAARKLARGAVRASAQPARDEQRDWEPRVKRESIEDPLRDWPEDEAEAAALDIERPAPDVERDEG